MNKSCLLGAIAAVASLIATTAFLTSAYAGPFAWLDQAGKPSFHYVSPTDDASKVRPESRRWIGHSRNKVPTRTAAPPTAEHRAAPSMNAVSMTESRRPSAFDAIFALPASVRSSFAQSPAPASSTSARASRDRDSMTTEMAIHECSVRASKYSNISELTRQFAVFRGCMYDYAPNE